MHRSQKPKELRSAITQRIFPRALGNRFLDRFEGPYKTAAIFWASGAVVIVTIIPIKRWSVEDLAYLIFAEAFTVTAALLRLFEVSFFPHPSHGIGLVIATFGIAGLVLVSEQYSLNLSVLFVWISLYAAVNFPLRATGKFISFAVLVYAAVLIVGGGPSPFEKWLPIAGTAFVAGGTVGLLIRELRLVSLEDTLTKLPNRRAWSQKLEEELERSRRNFSPLSIAMIDVDGMKKLNDTLGHAAGDSTLKLIGQKWLPLVRKGTLIARIGGDEFSLIAPDADEETAEVLLKRLQDAVPSVPFSFGIATWNGKESEDELLSRADQNMYKMKAEHTD